MREIYMTCSHENCRRAEKIWLPLEGSRGSEAALHPWCMHCGLVKNISDDRPKTMGHWMNLLSRISYHFSFTQCQKRLIAKELQSFKEFGDVYGITGSVQREMFAKTIRKYSSISINSIDSFLC